MTTAIRSRERLIAALQNAKAVIETNGWFQGDLVDIAAPPVDLARCPVCMIGAINTAVYGDPSIMSIVDLPGITRRNAIHALETAAGLVEETGLELAMWNDTDGRTLAEVLALFDQAIATAELAGSAA